MAVTINGSGVVTGVTALPDGIVTVDDLSTTGTASSSTFLSGTGAWAEAGGGKILQVVATDFSTTFSSTSPETFTDISGFSRTITCSATSSKVLVMVSVNYKGPDSSDTFLRLVRDSTAIAIGDAAGSRTRVWFELDRYTSTYTHGGVATLNYVDSPASVSELNYKLQIGGTSDSSQIYFNRSSGDGDTAGQSRGYSSIICMEIGA